MYSILIPQLHIFPDNLVINPLNDEESFRVDKRRVSYGEYTTLELEPPLCLMMIHF